MIHLAGTRHSHDNSWANSHDPTKEKSEIMLSSKTNKALKSSFFSSVTYVKPCYSKCGLEAPASSESLLEMQIFRPILLCVDLEQQE